MVFNIDTATKEILKMTAFADKHNLVPATSGNFSAKISETEIAITKSGRDKANLIAEDIMLMDYEANAIQVGNKPSAEALLHSQIYWWANHNELEVNCIAHVHSNASSVISKLLVADRKLELNNYELLKALSGIKTHKHTEIIPIFPNTQKIKGLAQDVHQLFTSFESASDIHAYLIEGHGIYTWGKDAAETIRHLDAIDTMLRSEIMLRSMK